MHYPDHRSRSDVHAYISWFKKARMDQLIIDIKHFSDYYCLVSHCRSGWARGKKRFKKKKKSPVCTIFSPLDCHGLSSIQDATAKLLFFVCFFPENIVLVLFFCLFQDWNLIRESSELSAQASSIYWKVKIVCAHLKDSENFGSGVHFVLPWLLQFFLHRKQSVRPVTPAAASQCTGIRKRHRISLGHDWFSDSLVCFHCLGVPVLLVLTPGYLSDCSSCTAPLDPSDPLTNFCS